MKSTCPLVQQLPLGRQRLLHFDDEIRGRPYRLGIIDQSGPGSREILVEDAGASTGILLNQHAVTMRNQFAHRRGNKADPSFVVFNLLRNTDEQSFLHLVAGSMERHCRCF